MLSSRVIHFTGEELVWQCKCGIICDCSSSSSGRNIDNRSDLSYGQLEAVPELASSQGDISNRITELWTNVVSGYTKCNLTYDTDRLPAISGMAHMFSRKRPSARYVAGLWSDTMDPESLLTNLMWYVHRPRFVEWRTRSKQWIAPTFSWASVRQEVVFPTSSLHFSNKDNLTFESYVDKTWVKIMDARCKPSTEDPMGQVTSGVLKFTGRSLRGRVISSIRRPREHGDHRLWLDGVDDSLSHGTKVVKGGERFMFYPDVPRDPLWWHDGTVGDGGEQVNVVCVPWSSIGRKRVDAQGWIRFYNQEYALVLHSSEEIGIEGNFESVVFQRVGLLLGRHQVEGTQEALDAALAASPGYFADDGGEVHTFTVV